jgi:hypothetical protein
MITNCTECGPIEKHHLPGCYFYRVEELALSLKQYRESLEKAYKALDDAFNLADQHSCMDDDERGCNLKWNVGKICEDGAWEIKQFLEPERKTEGENK